MPTNPDHEDAWIHDLLHRGVQTAKDVHQQVLADIKNGVPLDPDDPVNQIINTIQALGNTPISRRYAGKVAVVATVAAVAAHEFGVDLTKTEAQVPAQTTEILPAYALTGNESKQVKNILKFGPAIRFSWDPSKPNFGSPLKSDKDSGLAAYFTTNILPTAETKTFSLGGALTPTTIDARNFSEFMGKLQEKNPQDAFSVWEVPFGMDGKSPFIVPFVAANRDITVQETVDGKLQDSTYRDGTIFVVNPTTGKYHIVDQKTTPDLRIKMVLADQSIADLANSLVDPKTNQKIPVTTPVGSPLFIGERTDGTIGMIITDKAKISIEQQANLATPQAPYGVLKSGEVYPTKEPSHLVDLTSALEFQGQAHDGHIYPVTLGTNIPTAKLLITGIDLPAFQKRMDVYRVDKPCRIEVLNLDDYDRYMAMWKNQGLKVRQIQFAGDSLIPGQWGQYVVNAFDAPTGITYMPIFANTRAWDAALNKLKKGESTSTPHAMAFVEQFIDTAMYASTLPDGYIAGRTDRRVMMSEARDVLPQDIKFQSYLQGVYTK